MQGKKELQTELFSTVNIENFVPKNHFLRRIDSVLELGFIHKLCSPLYCENNGRPSIDPEVFFRMCLVGYFYGIDSDRQLCEELQFNLAYRWFCGFSLADSIPDHSSMTKIRDRLGVQIFEEVFNKILDLCRKKKLLKKKGEVLIDSSHIRADAALSSLVSKDATEDEIKNRPNVIRGLKFTNKTHVSCTDSDATLAGKTGVPKNLFYKVHSVVDAESRVILDPHVTTGAVSDGTQLLERIEFVEESRDYEVDAVTADRAYGFGENLEALENIKIKANIGTFHKDACDSVKNLNYDSKQDRFECPAGHWLNRTPAEANKQGTIRYSFQDRPCKTCPKRDECATRPILKREKAIVVSQYHQAIIRAAKNEKTETFVVKLRERMWKAEGLFAEAKQNHCLRRAKYRGLDKVQIQAYMIAMVQNLKRLVSHRFADLLEQVLRKFISVKIENFLIFSLK